MERILKDESHPLTQALNNQTLPKQLTRSSQIRITKAKTKAYENSCLQLVLKMKIHGYRDKYRKHKRKDATPVENQQEFEKRKKQSRSKPAKRLHKGNNINIQIPIQPDTNEVMQTSLQKTWH